MDMATAVDAFRHVVVLPRSRRVKSGNLGYLAARMYESNLVQMNGNLRKTVNCRVQSEHNSNDKYQNDLKKYCAYHHLDGDNWDLHQDVGDLIESKDEYRALVETQIEKQVIHIPCCGELRHFRRVKIHIPDEYTYRSEESYGKICTSKPKAESASGHCCKHRHLMYCHSVVVKQDVGLVEQLVVEHEVDLEST